MFAKHSHFRGYDESTPYRVSMLRCNCAAFCSGYSHSADAALLIQWYSNFDQELVTLPMRNMVHCYRAGVALCLLSLIEISTSHATAFEIRTKTNHATIEKHACRPDEMAAVSVYHSLKRSCLMDLFQACGQRGSFESRARLFCALRYLANGIDHIEKTCDQNNLFQGVWYHTDYTLSNSHNARVGGMSHCQCSVHGRHRDLPRIEKGLHSFHSV